MADFTDPIQDATTNFQQFKIGVNSLYLILYCLGKIYSPEIMNFMVTN